MAYLLNERELRASRRIAGGEPALKLRTAGARGLWTLGARRGSFAAGVGSQELLTTR
jgi:hypothetical protein